MRRAVLLIIIIILLSASLPACRSQSGEGGGSRTIKKDSDVRQEGRAKSAKPTSKDKLLLKEALMPAVDVIAQVRDAALGVTTGYTPPDLAAAIINGADGFLTQTRLKLSKADVSAAAASQIDEATDLVRSVADQLEKLRAAVKTEDKAGIKEIVEEIDGDLAGLRKIIGGKEPAGEKP